MKPQTPILDLLLAALQVNINVKGHGVWKGQCSNWCVGLWLKCQSDHHREKAIPMGQDITIAWLADSFRALIEKSMSICASSSPGRLPARLKSPNEAWSRYLIPDSLSQSDFAAEVIHTSGISGASSTCGMMLLFYIACSCTFWCLPASWCEDTWDHIDHMQK